MDPSIPVLLLSAGVYPNALSFNGCTVLMRAASILPKPLPNPITSIEKGLYTQVEALDVNVRDAYGDKAVHLATQRGHLSITELLLAAGVDTSLYG